jgi:ABC-type lipoprotein release transport system permease subunit
MSLRQFSAVTRLALKNMVRWRWRLATIFFLVAGSFSLFVLYSSMLSVSAQIGVAQTNVLNLPYDLMVIVEDGKAILQENDLPIPRFRREILEISEEAVAISAFTPMGKQELMGIQKDSYFYKKSTELVEGHWLSTSGELVLPIEYAERYQLHIGDKMPIYTVFTEGLQLKSEFTIVGLFEPDYQLAQPLILKQDALKLMLKPQPNRFMIEYDRSEAELIHLVEWMKTAYPKGTFLYSTVTYEMGTNLLQQIFQPGQWLLVLIFMFMGIGILTVSLITFLERRRELAVMKSIGVSNVQIVYALALEQGTAGIIGVLTGILIIFQIGKRISWFSQVTTSNLYLFISQGALFTLLVMIAGISFPTILAKVATVNQLLFARNIPIINTQIDHLAKPTGWILFREMQENLRFLKFDMVDGRLEGVLLKAVGDRVKQGEVIATQEMYFGLRYHEWKSPCDGIVAEYNANSGHMGILPEKPNIPHFPYPEHLVQDEIHHQKQMEVGRAKARAEKEISKIGFNEK